MPCFKVNKPLVVNILELQISFWVNWVFRQPDYSQLYTCKINCVFLFFTPRCLWL